MTASSIMDIAETSCNQFGKEWLKATLKDMQYNPKWNCNLFYIEGECKSYLQHQDHDQK